MSALVRVALASLRARRGPVLLSIFAIAVSAALLLSVETLKRSAKESFASTVSGVDLLVGARSGDVQLLLYAVFRLGAAANNFRWESYEALARHPSVAWTAPLSLGDSHRGFRVLGTTPAYFEHLRVRGDRRLELAAGRPIADLFETVIGADVAERLGYAPGQKITIAHGLGEAGLSRHDDKPFTVAGVLARTGTPVDTTVHVGLEAIEAIHIDWRDGAPPRPGEAVSAEAARAADLTPRAITAALVGVRSRLQVFELQRFVNEYPAEPLSGVLPGLALQQLWSVFGAAETALRTVSVLVAVAAALGMATMLLATLEGRRREMAILRAVGARPSTLFGLLMGEAAAIALAGALAGFALHHVGFALAASWIEAETGVALSRGSTGAAEAAALGVIVLLGALAGLVPAVRAYRLSVADGVAPRL